jgi:predicted metal-dependent HD superfamily phosphohydrolase
MVVFLSALDENKNTVRKQATNKWQTRIQRKKMDTNSNSIRHLYTKYTTRAEHSFTLTFINNVHSKASVPM